MLNKGKKVNLFVDFSQSYVSKLQVCFGSFNVDTRKVS